MAADEDDEPVWTRHISVAVPPLVAVGLSMLLLALLSQRAWVALVAIAPLLVLVADLVMASPPRITVGCVLDATRVNEGRTLPATVTLESAADGVVELTLAPIGAAVLVYDADTPADGTGEHVIELAVCAGEAVLHDVSIECRRWGAAGVEVASLGWRSPLGLLTWRTTPGVERRVWVHPVLTPTRSRLGVRRTGVRPGVHRSRDRGSGVEYHSSRPFEPGDRWRDLDHRLSARRDEPWITTRHAERSREIMIVVDLVADQVVGGESVADHAVRLADGVARDHLDDRDRVGAVVIGKQRVRAVRAADGVRQRDRIVAELIRASPRESAVGVRGDFRRWIGAEATVLVITPVLDRAFARTVLSMRRRGNDVSVIRVAADLIRRHRADQDGAGRMAATLRMIEDEAVVDELQRAGVVVTGVGLDDDPAVGLERHQLRHGARVGR